jgi:hypothetical protein
MNTPPGHRGERRGPNSDTFVSISNRDIYEELVKLRTDFQGFGLLRTEVTDHEARVRVLELANARLWWVRGAAGAALAAVVGDVVGRLLHVL